MRAALRVMSFAFALACAFWMFHHWKPDPLDNVMILAAFPFGGAAWWLIVERAHRPTRWRGILAGALSGACAIGLVYWIHFAQDVFRGEMVDMMALAGPAMAVMFFPLVAGQGLLVGIALGFVFQLVVGPRPAKTMILPILL